VGGDALPEAPPSPERLDHGLEGPQHAGAEQDATQGPELGLEVPRPRLRLDRDLRRQGHLGLKVEDGGRSGLGSLTSPPALVEYVVAHELVHLLEPRQTPTFWRLPSRVLPDYEARRDRLAQVGGDL